jgi:hypothetical protein
MELIHFVFTSPNAHVIPNRKWWQMPVVLSLGENKSTVLISLDSAYRSKSDEMCSE